MACVCTVSKHPPVKKELSLGQYGCHMGDLHDGGGERHGFAGMCVVLEGFWGRLEVENTFNRKSLGIRSG